MERTELTPSELVFALRLSIAQSKHKDIDNLTKIGYHTNYTAPAAKVLLKSLSKKGILKYETTKGRNGKTFVTFIKDPNSLIDIDK